MSRTLFALLALVLLLGLGACGETGSAAADPLLGQWQAVDAEGGLLFRADGSGERRSAEDVQGFSWRREGELVLLLFPAAGSGLQLEHGVDAEGSAELRSLDPAAAQRFVRP